MNFRIIRLGAMTRRDVIKNIIKWVLLFLILIILYSIEATLPFIKWQPYLCVTLACGVAIYETEMASFIFALFCGLFQDFATGGLFGFTSIWLAPCCLLISLLVENLMHRNLLNYLWLNAAVLVVIDLMELLFKYVIWRNEHIDIIVLEYILPATVCAIVISPLIYLLVKKLIMALDKLINENDIIGNLSESEEKEA